MDEAGFKALLDGVDQADPAAWDQLTSMVYTDLKRIAHGQMARITPGQTLSTTVLVHEAFEKLAAQGGLPVTERTGFYALCAYAMRQIIIDHYRRRSADKRTVNPTEFANFETRRSSPDIDNALLALGRALDQLSQRDPRLVEVFEMRYFAGMSDSEISQRLDLSARTVQRLAARARSWIAASLDEQS